MTAKSLNLCQVAEIKQKLSNNIKMAHLAKEYSVSPHTIKRLSEGLDLSLEEQSPGTRKRQVNLTVQQKAAIVAALDAGKSTQSLAQLYGVDPTTIRRVKSQKPEIMKRALELDDSQQNKECKRIHVEENPRDMALYEWFKQQRSSGTPISGDVLKAKALELNKFVGAAADFKASNGWLEKFKKRYQIRQLSMQGDKLSSDNVAAENFKETLHSYLKEKGYTEDEVYNADETGLFFKSLPKKTLAAGYERQPSGLKEQKERVTVMCCANASGSHKITPLLIGKSKNPRCFSKCEREKRPVKYTNSRSAWIDRNIFLDWFENIFVKEVRAHHPPHQKILLLLHNAPSHPAAAELNCIAENVEVMFLPPNVTALIQPMDQGVIEKMKKMFRKNLVKALVLEEATSGASVIDLAKKQTVKDCCYRISSSWDVINARDLRNAWNRILGKDDSPYEKRASAEEVNLLLQLLKDSPAFADCTFEMAQAWIEEDYTDNGWQNLNIQEIFERITSNNPEKFAEEDEEPIAEVENIEPEKEVSVGEAYDAALKLRTFLERTWDSTSAQISNVQEVADLILNIHKPM
ncbi:jerky protein homolog-like [Phymastichus coffea]|uniref:jerky protein homolog-like n=1 Tax=Phymastichus coffea TaxID=108790 RepID=UPI00273C0F7B|nr:jerky protein homolog-like [Phymastichus coffea]